MTNDEKAKAYDDALERARKIHNEIINNEIIGFPDQIREIFPQLRESESEDERIRKWLADYFSSIKKTVWIHRDITCEQILAWLEKQKEPTKEELYAEAGTTENEYIANTMKMVRAMREKQKEQKPAEWSEEDEDYMNAIIAIINRETALYPKGGATEDLNKDLIAWLKSRRPNKQD